eukprot:CAMPEP_0179057296 /NCGR_PEP_ID=MMETSP0796-20121207/24261_1 /TAXON_ID=73915 /ORGANISM="Pyrodinium bahamense, Strain pbaha01" /LENGTH=118 /DNA_ID=CAMNT_0020754011 /DNA_START=57 /DNA_END=413 /DNA_ORIENTATION=+
MADAYDEIVALAGEMKRHRYRSITRRTEAARRAPARQTSRASQTRQRSPSKCSTVAESSGRARKDTSSDEISWDSAGKWSQQAAQASAGTGLAYAGDMGGASKEHSGCSTRSGWIVSV